MERIDEGGGRGGFMLSRNREILKQKRKRGTGRQVVVVVAKQKAQRRVHRWIFSDDRLEGGCGGGGRAVKRRTAAAGRARKRQIDLAPLLPPGRRLLADRYRAESVDGARFPLYIFPKSSRRRGRESRPPYLSRAAVCCFFASLWLHERRQGGEGEGEGKGEEMLHPEREAKGHDGALRDTFPDEREQKKDSRKGPDGYVCQCVCVCVWATTGTNRGNLDPKRPASYLEYPRVTFREGIWPEGPNQANKLLFSRVWRTMGGREGDNIYK